nr:hypothetical protein Iba_chr11dCG10540 [Ipomoea batatas]
MNRAADGVVCSQRMKIASSGEFSSSSGNASLSPSLSSPSTVATGIVGSRWRGGHTGNRRWEKSPSMPPASLGHRLAPPLPTAGRKTDADPYCCCIDDASTFRMESKPSPSSIATASSPLPPLLHHVSLLQPPLEYSASQSHGEGNAASSERDYEDEHVRIYRAANEPCHFGEFDRSRRKPRWLGTFAAAFSVGNNGVEVSDLSERQVWRFLQVHDGDRGTAKLKAGLVGIKGVLVKSWNDSGLGLFWGLVVD